MFKYLLKRIQKRRGGSYETFRDLPVGKRGTSHSKIGVITAKEPIKLGDQIIRYRHEMKYVISESKAAAIERFIEPYLGLDHYCRVRPNGVYPIVSLYLDSDNLQLCRESLEGHKNRFKLRIRSYTDAIDYPRFFEIKRRVNTIIIKSRARVMHPDIPILLSGLSLPKQNDNADGEVLRQFLLYMNSIGARPMVRIRYMRRAYEDDSPNRVRVTLDRQLAYSITSTADVSLDGRRWQRHSLGGDVILEIKFTGRYPVWLSQMVECLSLRQQSMSKYATSVKNACLLRFCAPRISNW